uniref:Uncharacterized protein n=1 Tax=Anguilla anguilla TaxID=7936 RepID=A0A0E9XWL6_ANGAN
MNYKCKVPLENLLVKILNLKVYLRSQYPIVAR